MKQAKIYMRNQFAGILTEDEAGYSFCYDSEYIQTEDAEPISLTMPVQAEKFHSNVLFPFFDGLIPEGWLLDVAYRSWKIDNRDRMSLLLACCKDCIGSVSVIPVENDFLLL
jgi:serine/threonine-protein kinase HipA